MGSAKCFVIVLYNCLIEESESYITVSKALKIANEKGYLYIYDNSLVKQVIHQLDQVWKEVSYVHDADNSGLGKAYNMGAKYAFSRSLKWLVLLDQDTSFNQNFIVQLNLSIQNSNAKLYAPLLKLQDGKSFSPVLYRNKRGYMHNFEPGEHPLKGISPVNSGLCIAIEAFLKVGGYNEEIKLDFADFQFIEKFQLTYDKLSIINSVAYQDFSNEEDDLEKSLMRFGFYMDGAKKCKKINIQEKIEYLYAVFRHCVGLSLNFRSLIFLKFFFKTYFKQSK